MSFLTKRNGVFYLYFRENGKLRGRRISRDRAIALEYKARYDRNRDRARLGLPGRDLSWPSFCNKYLEYARTNKAPRSLSRDMITLKTFNRIVPLHNIADFNVSALEEYKSRRKEQGLKVSTINRELNTLKNMGQKLEDFEYAEFNPVKKVKWFVNKSAGKVRYFDKQEIKNLLKTAWEPWHAAVLIALYTGMRRGEVMHLLWDDVDFKKRTLAIQSREGWHPKGYRARILPVPYKLLQYLERLKIRAKSPAVVAYGDGQPAGENTLSSMMRKILKKAGIKGASFHTLRHTYASWLVMSGVDLYVVSKLLGHSSIRMTEVYAHLRPEIMQEAVERLEY